MTYTEILTDMASETSVDDLPDAALSAAKKLILDALGCALIGRNAPGVQETAAQMDKWGGSPEASIIGAPQGIPAPNAAFANGAMIHAFDLDDIYIPGTLHLSSVLVPTTLAVQQLTGATGQDALAALVMGVEVAGRIGMAERNRRRGGRFLPTSLAGGFGAVVVAARMMQLSPEECVHALGINYAQTSGNRQALMDCTLTKRMQPGFAARSALWAASLAQRGVTGPEHALEGDAGYFQTYMNGDVPAVDELTESRDWLQIERVAFKRWPSCGACHHAQAAAEQIYAEEDFCPHDIDRVELFGCAPLVSGPFTPGDNPQVSAQFSVEWAVAHTLLRGPASLSDYTDKAVRSDREVAELTHQIEHVGRPDDLPSRPEIPTDYPDRSVAYQGAIVHSSDGDRFTGAQCPAQTFAPGNMSFEDVVDKFHQCAEFGGGVSDPVADQIVDIVRRYESEDGAERLMKLLCL
ncbi:MAG: MmgE/PrpD family protein [Planctomycetota bacterium]